MGKNAEENHHDLKQPKPIIKNDWSEKKMTHKFNNILRWKDNFW